MELFTRAERGPKFQGPISSGNWDKSIASAIDPVRMSNAIRGTADWRVRLSEDSTEVWLWEVICATDLNLVVSRATAKWPADFRGWLLRLSYTLRPPGAAGAKQFSSTFRTRPTTDRLIIAPALPLQSRRIFMQQGSPIRQHRKHGPDVWQFVGPNTD